MNLFLYPPQCVRTCGEVATKQIGNLCLSHTSTVLLRHRACVCQRTGVEFGMEEESEGREYSPNAHICCSLFVRIGNKSCGAPRSRHRHPSPATNTPCHCMFTAGCTDNSLKKSAKTVVSLSFARSLTACTTLWNWEREGPLTRLTSLTTKRTKWVESKLRIKIN